MQKITLGSITGSQFFSQIHLSPAAKKITLIATSIFATLSTLYAFRKPIYDGIQNFRMQLFWTADTYYQAALTLEGDETFKLPNGRRMLSAELLRESIYLNPQFAPAYALAAMRLPIDEFFHLHDGTILPDGTNTANSRFEGKDLYMFAIALDPKNAAYYDGLSNELGWNELVLLPDGITLPNGTITTNTIVTDKDLYVMALQLDPTNGNYYDNLADALDKDEFFPLPDGMTLPDGTITNNTSVTNKKLYAMAIQLDPTNPTYYRDLANALDENESFHIPGVSDGRPFTKNGLLVEANLHESKD